MKQQRKKEKNIFTETDKRTGRTHDVVSLFWPDGERFRRRCPNLQTARTLLKRINDDVVKGKWEVLRDELKKKTKAKSTSVQMPVQTPTSIQPVVTPVTFGQVVREFKAHVAGVAGSSDWPVIQGYIADATLGFFRDTTILADITTRRIEEYVAYRLEDVRACTVNKELAVLRTLFGKAEDWNYITTTANPMLGIENLSDDSLIHDRYLRPSEFDALLTAASNQQRNVYSGLRYDHMPEFMIVLVGTGIRLSEALSLPISHINFEQRILSVKNKLKKRTKNGKERKIHYNQDTYDALVALRGSAVNPHGTIFQMVDGSSWRPHQRVIQRQFQECVKEAGLYSGDRTENVTIHVLRHTFGSRLALKGIPVTRIQYLMGHTDITTTQRYMHLNPEETYGDTEALQGMATNWQRQVANTAISL